jgi:hypothetical protein
MTGIAKPAPDETTDIGARIIRIGAGDMDSKPGILLVGAVDSRQQYASELARQVVAKLQGAAAADPAMLDSATYYVLAEPSPSAAQRMTVTPLWASATDFTPADDDRDGAIDEDSPEDLNGDGFITMLRVADPTGGYIAHPLDPRVLIPVKPENGEVAQYALYVEGTDNDGDERWNEDPIGGIDFNRNFPFDYPYFQPGSGDFACCDDDSRALADWLWEHQNIAVVITLGGDDNLHHLWPKSEPQGGMFTTPPAADHVYYERIAAKYKELAPREGEPVTTDQRGSLLKWAYLHFGRWAFGITPWWPLEPKKEVAVVKDAEASTDSAEPGETVPPTTEAEPTEPVKPVWDEKDKRGEAELNALKWMDATGADAFVPWQAVSHPDFPGKLVEVGGFKPYAMRPPATELPDIAQKQTQFIQAVAAMLPKVSFVDVQQEHLGEGVYRVEATLVNTGTLPTVSEVGEMTTVPYPLQLTIEVPTGATLVTGRLRERLPRLLGGGGSLERSWVVSLPQRGSVTLRAASPSVGTATVTVPLP